MNDFNDSALKARPTTYLGIQMRSRLEASVAQALTLANLPWEYEPRAFASVEGQYLPDFAIIPDGEPPCSCGKHHEIWIEARPTIERCTDERAIRERRIFDAAAPADANLLYATHIGPNPIWLLLGPCWPEPEAPYKAWILTHEGRFLFGQSASAYCDGWKARNRHGSRNGGSSA